ncbi:MAG: cytochrome b N-terminal domain-containing protein [Fimbriimonas sp.]|nr:cytochrome b N-terminal domain-containing protein [Fimbriimonas sp.]
MSDQPVERGLWRRIAAAYRTTESSQYLRDRSEGRKHSIFSSGFGRALRSDIVRSGPWRSAYPRPFPQTPKDNSEIAITSFWLHLHPAFIRRDALKIGVTYGLGGLAAGLFLVLAVTGIMEMFYYVPATEHAYKDMVDLQHVVSLGKILRNMHRWAAHAMVIIVSLHMLRVFLQKGYRAPRQLNWVVGVILLCLTMGLSFTGYLLPWDQLALWAVTVGTNMAGSIPFIGDKVRFILLGGPSVDQATLSRFYVLHVVVLPLVISMIMVYHFWRVRKDGFSGGK